MSAGAHGTKRRWRLSGHRKAHVDVVRNDINVTPLVDVMLVLLIIFMLMTLIMGRGHDVTLPSAAKFSEEKDKMQPVVTVDDKGMVYVEKTRIGLSSEAGTLKEMQEKVEAQWKAPKNPEGVGRIYFKAHADTPYENVYPVLEYVNKVMLMSSVDLAVAKAEGK